MTHTCNKTSCLPHLNKYEHFEEYGRGKRGPFCPTCGKEKRVKRNIFCAKCWGDWNDTSNAQKRSAASGNTPSRNSRNPVPAQLGESNNVDVPPVTDTKHTSTPTANQSVASIAMATKARFWLTSSFDKHGDQVRVLLDGGAQISTLPTSLRNLAVSFPSNRVYRVRQSVSGLRNEPIISKEMIKTHLHIPLKSGQDFPILVDFYVLPVDYAILGVDVLHRYQVGLQYGNYSDVWFGTREQNRTAEISMAEVRIGTPLLLNDVSSALNYDVTSVPSHSAPLTHHAITDGDQLLQGSCYPDYRSLPASSPPRPITTLPPRISTFGDLEASGARFTKSHPMFVMITNLEAAVIRGESVLSQAEFGLVRVLLYRFSNLYVKELPEVGAIRAAKYSLMKNLISDSPILQAPYRLGQHVEGLLHEALEKDVKRGFRFKLEKSKIRNTIPCFCVFERNKVRVVGAYNKLNDQLRLDPFPASVVADNLAKINGAKYIACNDGKSMYHQFMMDEGSMARTAWITTKHIYASYMLQFGIKNAGQHADRELAKIFNSIRQWFIRHMDDFITTGHSFEQWFTRYVDFHKLCKKYNVYLKLSPLKFQVCRKESDMFGFIVSSDGTYRPDPARFKPIVTIPSPRTVKEAQCFLGLLIFYKEFIRNHQTLTWPIRQAIKQAKAVPTTKITWSQDCEEAMVALKKTFLSNACLAFPRYDLITEDNPFEIQSDACSVACGSILSQYIDGKPMLIRATSRAFQKVELRYHIARKELLGIIDSLRKNRKTISPYPVRLVLDCANVPFFIQNGAKRLNPPWSRYAVFLNEFNYSLQFRKGIHNLAADALSRISEEATIARDSGKEDVTLNQLLPLFVQAAQEYAEANNITTAHTDSDNSSGTTTTIATVAAVDQSPESTAVTTDDAAGSTDTTPVDTTDTIVVTAEESAEPTTTSNLTSAPPASPTPPPAQDSTTTTSTSDALPLRPATLPFVHTEQLPEVVRTAYTLESSFVSALSLSIDRKSSEVMTSSTIAGFDVFDAQQKCSECSAIKQILESPEDPRHKQVERNYLLQNGLLVRRYLAKGPGKPTTVIYLPQPLRKLAIDQFHNSHLANHRGVLQTRLQLMRRFYWPTLHRDVKKHVLNCDTCRRTRPNRPPVAFQSFGSPAIMHSVFLDWVGPFPGDDYLLTVSIPSTDWIDAKWYKRPTARNSAEGLMEMIISRFGCPNVIETDLGTHFTSEVFKYLGELIGVPNSYSTLANSTANAILERKHKDIQLGLLSSLIHSTSSRRDYKKFLHSALFACRNTVREGREYSASMLMHGFEMKFPADIPEHDSRTFRADNRDDCKLMFDRIEQFKIMRETAAALDLEIRESKHKKQFLRKIDDIGVGAWVWYNPKRFILPKLTAPWTGPYIVLEKVPGYEPTYIIAPVDDNRSKIHVHRRYIKLVANIAEHENDDVNPNPDDDDVAESQSEDESNDHPTPPNPEDDITVRRSRRQRKQVDHGPFVHHVSSHSTSLLNAQPSNDAQDGPVTKSKIRITLDLSSKAAVSRKNWRRRVFLNPDNSLSVTISCKVKVTTTSNHLSAHSTSLRNPQPMIDSQDGPVSDDKKWMEDRAKLFTEEKKKPCIFHACDKMIVDMDLTLSSNRRHRGRWYTTACSFDHFLLNKLGLSNHNSGTRTISNLNVLLQKVTRKARERGFHASDNYLQYVRQEIKSLSDFYENAVQESIDANRRREGKLTHPRECHYKDSYPP